MRAGGHGIRVINETKHPLSHLDTDALKANVTKGVKGVKKVIVEETEHRGIEYHALALRYVTKEGTFLYCRAAGGNFSEVLEQLKSCQRK